MKRASSLRLTLRPSQPLCSVSTAVISRLLHLLGGPLHRLDDVLVAGAAANVPGQRPADLLLRRVRVLLQQRGAHEQHPRRAEPALQAVLLVEALLKRVQLTALGQALHRLHLAPVDLDGEVRARLDRNAVDEHGAGAAAGRVAADVRAGQAELLAQEVDEQQSRLHFERVLLPVHGDGDLLRRRLRLGDHDAIASFALRSPRAVKMRTTLRLYSSVPRTSVRGCAAAAASRAASSIASSSSACAVSASSASAARTF